MPVHNDDVAGVFEKIADLLEIRGENPFRVRAYRNGSREIRSLPRELAGLAQEDADLTQRGPVFMRVSGGFPVPKAHFL